MDDASSPFEALVVSIALEAIGQKKKVSKDEFLLLVEKACEEVSSPLVFKTVEDRFEFLRHLEEKYPFIQRCLLHPSEESCSDSMRLSSPSKSDGTTNHASLSSHGACLLVNHLSSSPVYLNLQMDNTETVTLSPEDLVLFMSHSGQLHSPATSESSMVVTLSSPSPSNEDSLLSRSDSDQVQDVAGKAPGVINCSSARPSSRSSAGGVHHPSDSGNPEDSAVQADEQDDQMVRRSKRKSKVPERYLNHTLPGGKRAKLMLNAELDDIIESTAVEKWRQAYERINEEMIQFVANLVEEKSYDIRWKSGQPDATWWRKFCSSKSSLKLFSQCPGYCTPSSVRCRKPIIEVESIEEPGEPTAKAEESELAREESADDGDDDDEVDDGDDGNDVDELEERRVLRLNEISESVHFETLRFISESLQQKKGLTPQQVLQLIVDRVVEEQPELQGQLATPSMDLWNKLVAKYSDLRDLMKESRRLLRQERGQRYSSWNEADMQRALNRIEKGELSKRRAAVIYNIPATTIVGRYKRAKRVELKKPGRPAGCSALSPKVEEEIVKFIEETTDRGEELSIPSLLEYVPKLLKEKGLEMPSVWWKTGRPGYGWWRRFSARFPNMRTRMTRAESLTKGKTEDDRVPCPTCQKLFSCKGSMARHMQHVHMNVRNFTCELCGKLYQDAKALKIHLLTHSKLKPFVCCEQDCREGFVTKQMLQFHYMRKHDYAKDRLPKIKRRIPYTFEAYAGQSACS